MLTVGFALLAAAGNAISSVLQRIANRREAGSGDTGVAALLHLFRQPVWLLGVSAIIAGFCLQALALSTGTVAEVQPLMALELPFTLLMATRVFRQRMCAREWFAVLAMTGGISAFLFAFQPTGGIIGHVGALRWILGAGVTGAVIVALGLAGQVLRRARGAALFGIGSGVCFALTAVFMSAAVSGGWSWSVLARWQTYLMVVAGIVAMLLLQLGLQNGTLVSVQPGVTLADPVVAVVLGATLFAEDLRTGGWLALGLAGAVAVGWGTVVLSRSTAASHSGTSGRDPGRTGDSGSGADPDRPDAAGP